jgi:hypothetical protein
MDELIRWAINIGFGITIGVLIPAKRYRLRFALIVILVTSGLIAFQLFRIHQERSKANEKVQEDTCIIVERIDWFPKRIYQGL